MNNNEIKTARRIFLDVLKNVVNQNSNKVLDKEIDTSFQKTICKMAHIHDLAHLLSSESVKKEILTNAPEKEFVHRQQIMAIYRYERINFDYQEIKETFIKEKIPFVPLKGLIIRGLYPEPWMRTSCDIDVLIKEEDLNRSIDALVKNKKYTYEQKTNFHDVSLYSPSGVHLELHFSIKENIENIDRLLEKVWDYCYQTEESPYLYKQTNEYFLFHTVAHMLYHFKSGGCGVRPFIDLYLILENFEIDEQKFNEMLDLCEIGEFFRQAKLLSNVWFSNAEHTNLTKQMEEYIFSGGVYGTNENFMAVQKVSLGRFKYIWTRIFSPYDIIKYRYPILKKHKWLTPFYQVRRWFSVLFKKRALELKKEMKVYDNVDDKKLDMVDNLFTELQIKG